MVQISVSTVHKTLYMCNKQQIWLTNSPAAVYISTSPLPLSRRFFIKILSSLSFRSYCIIQWKHITHICFAQALYISHGYYCVHEVCNKTKHIHPYTQCTYLVISTPFRFWYGVFGTTFVEYLFIILSVMSDTVAINGHSHLSLHRHIIYSTYV